ncbi:STAS domain-containing protein [Mycobacterium sp. URHB0044]|uniref:STAS domain-containing protein n=1 Tax=Mycobacterium sp. URHB0044 TaxID=1380386 RepID=UPI0009DD49D2
MAPTRPHKPPAHASRERVHFSSCPISASTLVVTAEGEIDASNARGLADYVESVLDSSTRLIVDLRGLHFFGTQGFSTLHTVNVTCSRRGVTWCAIPGPEVERLLRICDPGGGLPVEPTLEKAVASVVRGPRSHLRMLPPT